MNLNFIKNLLRSKTVRRSLYAIAAFVATTAVPLLPPQYQITANLILQALGVTSSAAAIKARAEAKGPITDAEPEPEESNVEFH